MKVWKIKRFCKRAKFAIGYAVRLAKTHKRGTVYSFRDSNGFWQPVSVFRFYYNVMSGILPKIY